MKRKLTKTTAGILAAVMMLSVGTVSVFAAGSGRGKNFVDTDNNGICDYSDSICRFTDADNDGICDYSGSGCRYTDTDNDGICDHAGSGCRYTDTDNDGICDNYGTKQGRRFCGGRNK